MSDAITQPGIYYDISANEYFSDPCPDPSFTQSLAKVVLDQSARHAMIQHPRLYPVAEPKKETYSAALAIGNAAHMRLIGRGKELFLIHADDFRTKDAQKLRGSAIENGRTPILWHHLERAESMVSHCRDQLLCAGWEDAFREGRGEVVLAWQEDGMWLRTMIDWFVDPTEVYDFKTGGGSFAPHVIAFKAEQDGWDIQAAMHERALDAIFPESSGRRRLRYVCQENYPPYAMLPVEMSEHWLTMGRKKLDMAIAIWRRCLKSGNWESYPLRPMTMEYPSYKETRWLDRELSHDDQSRERMLTDLSGG